MRALTNSFSKDGRAGVCNFRNPPHMITTAKESKGLEILKAIKGKKKKGKNRSPKSDMWSAIPVALLCMIVNLSKGKQGSPKEDKVL